MDYNPNFSGLQKTATPKPASLLPFVHYEHIIDTVYYGLGQYD